MNGVKTDHAVVLTDLSSLFLFSTCCSSPVHAALDCKMVALTPFAHNQRPTLRFSIKQPPIPWISKDSMQEWGTINFLSLSVRSFWSLFMLRREWKQKPSVYNFEQAENLCKPALETSWNARDHFCLVTEVKIRNCSMRGSVSNVYYITIKYLVSSNTLYFHMINNLGEEKWGRQ